MAAMTESSLSSQTAAAPPAGRYRINPHNSSVTFRTRHLFGLAPVHGTLALRDGTIDIAEPATDCVVGARVAASSFTSGNPARDAAVLSPRLLDAATYPSLVFVSTALISEPGPRAGNWLLCGELEVRGVTRPVEVRISAVSADASGSVRVRATLSVDRYAFGITAYRGLAARRLTVDLDIQAVRAQPREGAQRS
jgi:polyisoprenoid-binding protein YceI